MWKSNAEWPKHPDLCIQFSDDKHDTQAQAEAVCRMLRERGFGGDGKIFPVRTWVTPPTEDRRCKGDDCDQHHCPKCGAHTLGWLDTFQMCSTCELELTATQIPASEHRP